MIRNRVYKKKIQTFMLDECSLMEERISRFYKYMCKALEITTIVLLLIPIERNEAKKSNIKVITSIKMFKQM